MDIPTAILVAGVIVAVSVIYAVGRNTVQPVSPPLAKVSEVVNNAGAVPDFKKVRPVSVDDHIFGDPNAPVKVVEFSDPECPFCKRFHETMHQILTDYDGKVAWIYRHMPLDSLHSKARKEAEATECVAELGGNVKFWAYLDRIFQVTPSNDGLNPAELPRIAEYAGLDVAKFTACLVSGRYAAKIEASYQDGLASGGQGTPYSVVVKGSEPIGTIDGAYPYADVKTMIEAALK